VPTARVGDITMHYVEAGGGEPLVLIMGFGGDHLAWGFQLPVLAERYRVIAFDNRGAGQTDQPDAPYTTREMAADTAGLMDALGVERAHVLGVSMGGMIAQELALHHAERVQSLQLHCTYARPDGYTRARLAAARVERRTLSREDAVRSAFFWLFARGTYNERPEFVEAIVQTALANPHPQSLTGYLRQGDAVLGHDTLDRLGAITCPTLVSVAAEDILVPPRFSREIAARIPGAELRVVDDAGHVYFWERPDVFNTLCLEFLARVR
jgi:pimeloyl-ACP methyl ester carboxylesterase